MLDWGPTRGNGSALRARVVNVYVELAWRRQGVAGTLVSEVIADCERCGIRTFGLSATTDAEALYRALGFSRAESEMVLRR